MSNKNSQISKNTKENKTQNEDNFEEEDEEESAEITSDVINYIFNDTKQMNHHTMGICTFPTGKILTADPLCYLQNPKNVFFKSKRIPPGDYPVELSIVGSDFKYGIRIAGARLKITSKKAISYTKAFCELKNKEIDCSGFDVEAGMACFCDEAAAKGYWKFLEGWYKENKDGNIYDDYFAELFAQSYKEIPDLQREGGDFLMWKNPIDESLKIPMFASGFGDGYYDDFWGIDEEGEICELVTAFFDPKYYYI